MQIHLVCIMLSLQALIGYSSVAEDSIFAQSNCTIVYALKGSADKNFNDQIIQLHSQINNKNIRFIDLNNWRNTPPHIEVSGRFRNQFRQQYDLTTNANQAIVLDKTGQVLSRYNGAVTLVYALLDCH